MDKVKTNLTPQTGLTETNRQKLTTMLNTVLADEHVGTRFAAGREVDALHDRHF